jgi:hypothetical protein
VNRRHLLHQVDRVPFNCELLLIFMNNNWRNEVPERIYLLLHISAAGEKLNVTERFESGPIVLEQSVSNSTCLNVRLFRSDYHHRAECHTQRHRFTILKNSGCNYNLASILYVS